MRKVVFTGGGTAGHVTPNIALIEHCQDKGWSVDYVGSEHGIEHELIAALDVRFHAIASGKLRRYFSWQNFIDPFKVIWGIGQSLLLCLQLKPDLVFSKGGFVSMPIVFAAWMCRIPVISHESDVTPGLANRLTYPLCRKVCLTFDETLRFLDGDKAMVTGTPVRRAVMNGDPDRGRAFLGFVEDKPIVLIFGGSLGAQTINQAVREIVEPLQAQFNIVHVVGAGERLDELGTSGYQQYEYIGEQFGDVLASASLVISRAGANSIYELLLLRKPHLLIPLSRAASRGDQLVNARTFVEMGYSRAIEEDALTAEKLLQATIELYDERAEVTAKLENFQIRDSVSIIMREMENVN